jgi:hypothetical protein
LLIKAVEGMGPVRMRSRFGAFAVVMVAGLIWPTLTMLLRPMRADLAVLPRIWVVVGAVLWGAAFVLSLAVALVPRRGDVLPGASRASRVGFLAILAVFFFGLFFTVQVPGVSMVPADRGWTLFTSCLHCSGYVFCISSVPLLVSFLVLRRLMPVGTRLIGMGLGAAGGALGGLALHFICPLAGTDHVVLAHVGGMIMAATAGATLLPILLGR